MEIIYKPKQNIFLSFGNTGERVMASRSIIVKHDHSGEELDNPEEVILFLIHADGDSAIIDYISKEDYDSNEKHWSSRWSQYMKVKDQIQYFYSIPNVDKTKKERIENINDPYIKFLAKKFNSYKDDEDAFFEIQSANLDMTEKYAMKYWIDQEQYSDFDDRQIIAFLLDYICENGGK